MDRGLYAAASSMHMQQAAMDAAAVNVANVNTVGYRRSVPVMRGFQLVLTEEIARSPGHTFTGVPGGGAYLEATYHDATAGPIQPTDGPLDVALHGPGFFAVGTPAGTRYTRAGNFELNGLGELVTADGQPVLGPGGPIVIGGTTVAFTETGGVVVDGVEVDQLLVVEFADVQGLVREDHSRYYAPPLLEATRVDATETTVVGRHLERANVNMIEELAQLIVLQRSFEMATRTVGVVDRTLGLAVQEIPAPA